MGMHLEMTGVDHQPFAIRGIYEPLQELFPDPFVSPSDKATMGIAPASVLRWKISPWRSGSQDPKHGIEELAVILRSPSPDPLPAGQMGLQELPNSIADVVTMKGDCFSHPLHLPKTQSRDYTI